MQPKSRLSPSNPRTNPRTITRTIPQPPLHTPSTSPISSSPSTPASYLHDTSPVHTFPRARSEAEGDSAQCIPGVASVGEANFQTLSNSANDWNPCGHQQSTSASHASTRTEHSYTGNADVSRWDHEQGQFKELVETLLRPSEAPLLAYGISITLTPAEPRMDPSNNSVPDGSSRLCSQAPSISVSKPTVTSLGLSATPIFRPVNGIMNKAGPSGSPPSCADQVLAKLCPILPAPKTPSMAYDPLHATYTPAESTLQLPPAIQLYRFDRSQELQAILRVLAHLFRPTEMEETKMYKHLFEALEDQNVRRYYELKAQQLHRKAYPESLTVFGRKGVPQAANQKLYPSQFPSPASKRGASAPSTPTPIRSGSSQLTFFSDASANSTDDELERPSLQTLTAVVVRSGSSQLTFFSDASANSTDDELERPSLQTLTAVVVQELYFKIQDQKSVTYQQGHTPPQTPSKRMMRDQKDKIVADRANKKIKQYLTDQFQASSQPDPVPSSSSDTAHVASSPRSLHISQLPKRSNSLPKTPRKPRASRLAYPASYSQALPVTRQFSNPFLQSPLSSPALSSQLLPSSTRQFSSALLQSPSSSPLLAPQTSRQCSNMLLQSPLSSPALSSQSFPVAYQFSNHLLQPPMVAYKLDVQNTIMLDPSFGLQYDFDSASLPLSIQGPQVDLFNSMPVNQQSVGDFQAIRNNDMAMYFYNKGFEYAQARHNESIGPPSQDAFWLCSESQSNPLSSPTRRLPPANALDASLYNALQMDTSGLNGVAAGVASKADGSSSSMTEENLSQIMDIISFDS